MSYAHRLGEELNSLKDELSKLIGEKADTTVSASRERLEDVAKVLGGVVDDIEQFVGHEEERIEGLISSRPVMSIVAAFAAGLAVGLILRRR